MTFRMNRPLDDPIAEYIGTKNGSHWPPLTSDGRSYYILTFEAPSPSYRATQIEPDIQLMLQTFPDLILSGTQDFEIDGDFYRLIITKNKIQLLEGHVVYS